jgi:hypothetical protein
MGIPGKPMTSEELATIWHFPGLSIKAPFVKTTAFKKAAAPVSLPIEAKTPEFEAPKNLEDVMAEKNTVIPTFDYDNDEFEKQFALDKEAFKQSRPARAKQLEQVAQAEAERQQQTSNEAAETAGEIQGSKNTTPVTNFLPPQETPSPLSKKEDQDGKVPPGNLPFLD